jgi:hypothetical protein
LNQYRKRIDKNHVELANFIESIPGCALLDLNRVGGGCTDLLVQRKSAGICKLFLIEIKTKTGKLNPKQIDFHNKFQCHVARTKEDILRILGFHEEL